MGDLISGQDAHGEQKTNSSAQSSNEQVPGNRKKSISMHEGVGAWCDCCSCEAEPYWLEVADELGVDLGSDYEEQDTNR